MIRTALLAALFINIVAAQSSLDLEGRYWIPQMSSRLQVIADGFGTEIDGKRDLGLSDANFPMGGFTWHHGRSEVTFGYTPIEFQGDNTVSRTVIFKGTPYTVGTRVVSDLSVGHLQLSWSYQFIRLHEGRFRIGPMIEADGFLLHGSLSAPNLSPPMTEKEDLAVGLPAAGIDMGIEPWRGLEVYGRAAGMEVGSYGYYVGSDSGVRVHLWKHLLLTAGYRTLNLHVENSPDFARFRLRGPFVGAGVHF